MAKFRFSRRAETDVFNIGEYTLHKWGEAQKLDPYYSETRECCAIEMIVEREQ